MNHITIKNASYRYPTSDRNSLEDISLEIKKGKLYALIGSNGSGKTTLCNLLRGFIPYFYKGDLQGEIIIDGTDIFDWDMNKLAEKVGFIFQNPFTQISGVKDTVFEEIAYGLENLGIEKDEIVERVNEIMRLLGIEYLTDKNPNDLSGGQKQRIAFASIIVMEPDILVIDEPTSQLDPQGTEEIFQIIEIMKQRGKTIILVEHKIELIAEYADYIVLLEDGKIVAQGTTEEMLTDETLLQHGGALPQYSLLGLEMKRHQLPLKEIPVTEEAAKQLIEEWLNKTIIKSE